MKSFKLNLFLLITFLSNTYTANASHMMGAQITYKSIGKYKYDVYVEFYRDCRGIPLSTPVCTVRVASTGAIISAPALTLVSITDITPFCSQTGKKCYPVNTSSGKGVEKHIFKTSIDLTTQAKNGVCQVLIGAGQCCRNGEITTGSSGELYWVWSMVDLCKWYKNSSSICYSDPIAILGCNQPVYYNIAARDFTDNDSLVYEFVDPMQSWTTKTSWIGGKNAQNPFSDYWPSGYSKSKGPNPQANPPIGTFLDRSTGQLVFTPTDCSESAIASIRISEYHKDSATGKYVLVGYVTRDHQYWIISAADNIVPSVGGPENVYFADSAESKFTYSTFDKATIPKTGSPILSDTVKLIMLPFVPLQTNNATFKVLDPTKKNPTGIFSWKPLNMANTKPYLLVLQARDNNCTYNSVTHKPVNVYVRKKSELTWVEGTVFYDANKNCKRDSFEYAIPGAQVSADSGFTTIFMADSSGYFGGWLPAKSYYFMVKGKYASFVCTKSQTVVVGKTYSLDLGGMPGMVISGSIYNDTLKNCKADSLEPRLKNQFVYTEPGYFSSSTDSKGQWELKVPAGEYKIMYSPKRFFTFIKCPTKPYIVNIFNDTIFKNQDIAIYDSANMVELSASLISGNRYRRGFKTNVTIVVSNNATKTISNAYVWIKFSKKLKYDVPASYVSKTDSTIQFSVPTLKLDEKASFKIVFDADASTCSLNDTMTTRVWLDTSGLSKDVFKTNNYDKKLIKIVAAVDPNIKEEHNTNGYAWREGNKLRYFVQFQNTGTGTAVNITVIDTLHYALLGHTLNFNGASHPYEYMLNTNVLKVTFPNIYLVDTSVSKEKSIGHFDFTIDINPLLSKELKFNNRADIYFDYASAVKTNKQYITYTSYIKTGQTNKSAYCPADTIKVDYSSKFRFNSGNSFKLILSDKTGSFASGTKVIDSVSSTSVSGSFKTLVPSVTSESSLYKVKVVSTNPAGTILDDGASNSFMLTGTLTKPTFGKMDSLSCGKDSIQLTINSAYSGLKIYDRKTLISSPGSNKKPKIKPGLGMHYLTVTANHQSCLVSSDTLKFLRDTFPVISIRSTSHSNLNVCENDTVTLKVTGCNTFDLLGNSFAFIKSYSSTEAKRVIAKTGDSLMAKYTGANGCIDTSNILKFTRNTNPTVTITSSDPDLNVCMNDSIVLTGGGASTYQLFKNSSAFKSSFTSTIKPGTMANNDKFQLLGIDANGCKDSSDVLKFTVDTVPNVKISCSDTDLVLCINTSAVFTFGGATNYELYKNSSFWKTPTSNPYTTSGINDNDIITVLGSTTKNCSNYSNALKFKISNPKVTLKLNNTGLICSGDSIHFSFTGAKSYQIFKNNTLMKTTTKSFFKSTDFANNDVVFVEGTDTFGCLAKSSSITLSIKTSPIVKLYNNDKDNAHCIIDNVVLSLAGAAIYNLYKNGTLWKPNATSPVTTKDIKSNDMVYLKGTATNGCSANSDTLKFTVYQLPNVNISSPSGSSVCEKDSILLNLSGGVKYDFYLNNTFIKQLNDSTLFIKDVVKNDEVYVYGYSNEGCKNRSNKLTLSVNTPPTISIANPDTDNTTCKGENVDINFMGGDSYDLYRNNTFWKKTYGNPLSFEDAKDNEELYAIGFDGNGCKAISNTIKLTVLGLPSVLLTNPDTDNTTCDGEKVVVNFTGGTKYDIYQNGSMLNFNITSPYTLSGIKNGDRIHVTGRDINGCTDSSNILNLTVLSLPTITITNPDTDNSHCKGDNVIINFSGGATYDLFKNNILWKTNTGSLVNFNDVNDKDEIYSLGAGANGCVDTSNKIKFTVWPLPTKPIITKTGTVLSSSYTTGNQWYEGTTKLIGATSQNYSPVKTGTYFVNHTDVNGCISPLSDGYSFSVFISKVKLEGLKIYPNPASDHLIIETGKSGKFHISLIDITGKLVKEETFTGNHFEWQLKPAKGLYHLKIVNEKGESENVVVEFK